MKFFLSLLSIIFFVTLVNSQNYDSHSIDADNIDYKTLTHNVCSRMAELQEKQHVEIYQIISNEYLVPYFEILGEEKSKDFIVLFSENLLENCEIYKNMMADLYAGDSGEKLLSEMPEQKITKKQCEEMKNIEEFYYLGMNDQKISVVFTRKLWQDFFPDQTSTVNEVEWLENCSFVLTFKHTDNPVRIQYFKPGEKFYYTVIEKKEKAYDIVQFEPHTESYGLFTIYLKE